MCFFERVGNKTLSHFSNTQINFRVEKLLSPRREKCIHYSPLGDGFTLFYPSLGGGVRGEGRNKTLSRICKFTLFVNKFLSPKWRCCKLTQKKTALKSGLEFVLQFLVCRRLVCVRLCMKGFNYRFLYIDKVFLSYLISARTFIVTSVYIF